MICATSASATTKWTRTVVASGEPLVGVSCPSQSFCAAITSSGKASTYNGATWTTPLMVDGNGFSTGAQQLSCAGGNFCVAVDPRGEAIYYNGSAWTSPQSIDGVALTTVACTSRDLCIAGDEAGDVLLYNGIVWTHALNIAGAPVTGSSCVEASFCIAIDDEGNVAIYSGGHWTGSGTIFTAGSAPVSTSVSCVTDTFCVALHQGNRPESFVYDGSGWTWRNLPGTEAEPENGPLACGSITLCLAVPFETNAYIYNGSVWLWSWQQYLEFNNFLLFESNINVLSLSCADQYFCVGGNKNGSAYIYTEDVAPINTAAPVISDETTPDLYRVGDTLRATNGTWVGEQPMTFSYQWELCNEQGVDCAPITTDGNGETYVLTEADVGLRSSPKTIRVLVAASNESQAGVTAGSNAEMVGAEAPGLENAATIAGRPIVGETLSVTPLPATGSPTPTVSYQWYYGQAWTGTPIPGATGEAYELTNADGGKEIYVAVKASNDQYVSGGTSEVGSISTQPIAPAGSTAPVNTAAPTITDLNRTGPFQVGDELNAGTGTWISSTPVRYRYEWQICRPETPGECDGIKELDAHGAKYVIPDTYDVPGDRLKVVVTATNTIGSSTASSAETNGGTIPREEAPIEPVTPTETPKQPSASAPIQPPTPTPVEGAKVCTKSALVLTEVEAIAAGKGASGVGVAGVASQSLNGDTVQIETSWNGKIVATAPQTMRVEHGVFSGTALALPPRALRFTSRARYRAVIVGVATSNSLKATRRARLNQWPHERIGTEGGYRLGTGLHEVAGVTIRGRVTGYLTKPIAPLYLTEYNPTECGAQAKIVGAYRVGRRGRFVVHFHPSSITAPIVYRLQTEVAGGPQGKVAGQTYTTPLPINVG